MIVVSKHSGHIISLSHLSVAVYIFCISKQPPAVDVIYKYGTWSIEEERNPCTEFGVAYINMGSVYSKPREEITLYGNLNDDNGKSK